MSCSHSNPAGYAFCRICGSSILLQRCKCGFGCAPEDLFCGQCGKDLCKTEETEETGIPQTSFRYKLEELVTAAKHDEAIDPSGKVAATQDDIAKLLQGHKKE